ncbi:MAG TPA: putative sulfate exporter family transporter [Beijerinckiaceae bacterium]|nr:putative sulfate exporter family transporter [Beijerinckiaceae bacterium]
MIASTHIRRVAHFAPGLALSIAVSIASIGISEAERRLGGGTPIDSYVAAILLGTAMRTGLEPGPKFDPGIRFSAKTLLEIGVALLGASIGIRMLGGLSAQLIIGIAALVAVAVASSYAISRAVGLSSKLSIMIACGNSICGNSAIAAVAPVVDADPKDMAAAIAFTAIWGIPIVVALPFVALRLGLRPQDYGAFAGLTIYSVPQVMAATLPIGAIATQIGTLTKLVRIVMLAPVLFVLSLVFRPEVDRGGLHRLLMPPWFILGFFALMALRSVGGVPDAALGFVTTTSNTLTLVAMAALGLNSDAKLLARAGGRVTIAIVASMFLLGLLSFCVVSLD